MFTTQDRKFLSMLHIADDGSDVQIVDAPEYVQYLGFAERPVPLLDVEAMARELLRHCAEIGHVALALTDPIAIFVDVTEGRAIPIEQAYREMFGA